MEELEFTPSEMTFICSVKAVFQVEVHAYKGHLWFGYIDHNNFRGCNQIRSGTYPYAHASEELHPGTYPYVYVLEELYRLSLAESLFAMLDEKYTAPYLLWKMGV